MIRAAPTVSGGAGPLKRNAYSSNSSRYELAVDRHRDRVLRDRHRVPRQPADLAHLRVRLALLDLARVEDHQLTVDRVGDIRAVAVVAQRQAVRVLVALPDRARMLRVADVDRGERLHGGAGRVERVPVGREVALVPEARVRAPVESSTGCRQSWRRRRRSTPARARWPGCPSTAASSPRRVLRLSDSCGDIIGSEVSESVCTGCDGSDMSSTATPSDDPVRLSALIGNSSVVS